MADKPLFFFALNRSAQDIFFPLHVGALFPSLFSFQWGNVEAFLNLKLAGARSEVSSEDKYRHLGVSL